MGLNVNAVASRRGIPARFLRAVVTIIVCVAGLGYVLYNHWFQPGWNVLTLVGLAFQIAVVNPFCDYWAHRLMHENPWSFFGKYHNEHHREIKLPAGDPLAETLELWCYPAMLAAYACPATRFATLGLLQYAFFHQLSHDLPELVPGAARHHGIHHMSPYKNHGVSAAWPDRVFGTYLPKPPAHPTRPRVTFMVQKGEQAE